MFRKIINRLKKSWIVLFMFVSFISLHADKTKNVIGRTME